MNPSLSAFARSPASVRIHTSFGCLSLFNCTRFRLSWIASRSATRNGTSSGFSVGKRSIVPRTSVRTRANPTPISTGSPMDSPNWSMNVLLARTGTTGSSRPTAMPRSSRTPVDVQRNRAMPGSGSPSSSEATPNVSPSELAEGSSVRQPVRSSNSSITSNSSPDRAITAMSSMSIAPA